MLKEMTYPVLLRLLVPRPAAHEGTQRYRANPRHHFTDNPQTVWQMMFNEV
jgi:hypothetical protein